MKLTDHADRERARRLDREAARIRDAIAQTPDAHARLAERLARLVAAADAGDLDAAARLDRVRQLFALAKQRRDARGKP